MGESCPTLSIEGTVATVRLNAPERHNALSLGDIAMFAAHLDQVASDADVRVLVLSSSGPSFCSGHHLGHFDIKGRASVPPPVEFERLADALEALPIPSICVLQGNVYAGGIDLVLACDFRIGLPIIRIGLPAARLGIHLYPGALRRYVTRLGLAAAKRLCLLGATLDAEQLKQIGFLDEMVDAAMLDGAVAAMASAIKQGAPLAVRGMKRALNGYANGTLDDEEVAAAFRASFASADLIEGLRAKAERREPVFTGR